MGEGRDPYGPFLVTGFLFRGLCPEAPRHTGSLFRGGWQVRHCREWSATPDLGKTRPLRVVPTS